MHYYYKRPCERKTAPVRSAFMQAEEIDRERAMSGWNPYEGEEELPEMEGQREMDDRWDAEEHRGMEEHREMDDRWDAEERRGMDDRWDAEERRGMDDRWDAEEHRGMEEHRDMDDRWDAEERRGMDGHRDTDDRWEMNDRPEHDMDDRRDMPQPFFMQPDFSGVMEEQMEIERDWRALQAMYPEAAKLLLPLIEEECDKMEYEGSPMFDGYPDQTTVWMIQERIRKQAQDQMAESFPAQEEQEQQIPEEIFSMQFQGSRRNRPGRNWLDDMIRVMLLQEMHHRRCRHHRCRRSHRAQMY